MHALSRCLQRTLALIDFLLLTLLAWSLACLPRALTRSWYFGLFRAWSCSFVRALGVQLFLHQHYTGQLPKQYLLIANHPSALEDIGIPALFPVVSLAKIEVADWWIFGRISRAAGTLYVKREDRESRHAALEALIAGLRSGVNICLYPEGGCKGRRLYTRFQRGAFAAACATGTPIVPVYLHYEAAEAFEWDGQTLIGKLWEIARSPNGRVNVHVFEPLRPGDHASEEALRDAAYALYQHWDRHFHEPGRTEIDPV